MDRCTSSGSSDTFHTKSLYQHVQRLITRFYRQFDERDPDWSKLKILHGWGGSRVEGVYSYAADQHGVPPLNVKHTSYPRVKI